MPDHPGAVMLFAAGFGTRMGALTRDTPKPLIEVAGRPLLDHALSLAEAAGVPRKVVNAHYLADQVTAHLRGRDVAVSVERDQILDTGGGLRAALPTLGDGPVFTMNTDAVWSGANPLTTLADAWDPAEMDALLLLIPAARATGHSGSGDFTMDAAGRLTRGGDLVFTGAQIVDPSGLRTVAEPVFSIRLLWEQAALAGRFHGVIHQGGWADVGHPGGITAAEAMLAADGPAA